MQTKILLFILLFTLIFSSPIFAASLMDSALRDGIGVRALGMGGAFTGLANDPTAIFYNPAGIVYGGRVRLESGYLDINSQAANDNNYLILNLGTFAYANWSRGTISGETTHVYALSYARNGGNGISWGVTYKNIFDTSALGARINAASCDIGILGSFPNSINWGILFQDIIDNGSLGGGVRVGLSYQLFNSLTLAGDLEYRNIKSSAGPEVFGHAGLEMNVTRGFILRGGYNKDRWTAGGSLSFKPVELHYGLQMSRGNGEQATQLLGVKIEL